MTSFAFILGVVPLLIGRGAGAEMRRTLGTAVFSGMLGVTVFGIFLTPVFFNVIDWLGESRLFASRGVRGVGGVILFILTFAWLKVLLELVVCSVWLRPVRSRRNRWIVPTATPAKGRSRGKGQPTTVEHSHVFTLFHPSADLRLGAVDHHHAGGRHRRVGLAHRPVSGDHAADGGGVGLVSRRRRRRRWPTRWRRRSSSRSTAWKA